MMAPGQTGSHVEGKVVDAKGNVVPRAMVELSPEHGHRRLAVTDSTGRFEFSRMLPGSYVLAVSAPSFQALSKTVKVTDAGSTFEIEMVPALSRKESVVVTADVNALDLLSPDPAEKVFVKQDLIDANPGRPGAPVSVPGYPIETASSGIKAPQYFAPGVAGDHGEPIAQFIAVGSYLLPNNLSANAHGNGYADPNLLIPSMIESVQVDGGAFNVREGNHAVNVAATYGLRSRVDPFASLTGDYRDIDLVAGMSPAAKSSVVVELSFGNGFLRRLEHRQQYKLNAQRTFDPGRHEITVLGIAYWGKSYIPGLTPVFADDTRDVGLLNYGDTIDPRQRDQTHTALVSANDVWRLSATQELQVSGFFRTYNLTLYSNFGDGLIRQSEFRTVAGQSTSYANKFSDALSVLAGLDWEREAPRRDNLDHYDDYTGQFVYGPFTKVDSSDVTITSVTPYGAVAGGLGSHFRYYGGWRRDQIDITNVDRINAGDSYQKWVGVNSPKATASFVPGDLRLLPLVSASFGEAFFTDDPRIALGSGAGSSVARSHNYQLVVSKTAAATDFKLTLGHVTTSSELAKIDPDTGLQEDQGPGRLEFLTAAVRQSFTGGSVLVTFSKADARDVQLGEPVPEAPRTIFDVLASLQRLPFGLQARGEFEFVGRKTLGTGCLPDVNAQCLGTAVKEFRGAVARPFLGERLNLGVNFLVAGGHTGQTLESFGGSDFAEVVGVRIPYYASVNVTWKFGGRAIQ
ncbi:hypothetical protein HDF16_002441 [Granulicella aggregans]|uniref:TonB-dependent receptor-like beta-barrel domain-containing protein n=1 Tax=Granulicella aggregans TaxID=474949 RepID=A0A7W7ZD79_9BACT|nr:carboxypeptidase-like regulatory domain-containing protein [Granulicella aggregans]MBB5057735.1 hypothetical protein [Granulicella aggregans]